MSISLQVTSTVVPSPAPILANNSTILAELMVLRIQQVAEKLSIGKSTIYDWLNLKSPRYDETFPKPFKLGGKAIGWLSSEVDAWLLNRVALTRVTDLTEVEMESDTL
ncbi:AlpA family transcriptional regulator [Entomomonas moraniae]|uniref:AlpA family transcriptional regulator n=1 Tax=Entomomonas moraniae TaxID=2213226 RepID=A0A3Q9JJP1_9GAMM|nr:AlpA family transcriptional regulator [Entomomonas moraniae]AZS49766.1 AlpA family transcriptional regulator [Entomomonas moraniae]